MKSFVAYYRVSTQQQGRSGLGIEAQRAAIAAYVVAGDWRQLAEYEEHESGKGDLASVSRTADYAALRLLSNAAGDQ